MTRRLLVAVAAFCGCCQTFATAADPNCLTGLRAADVCCARSCGRCGDHGCGALPGGSAHCCSAAITAAHHSCATHNPPCTISTPAPTPSPGPTGPIKIDVDEASVLATVAPEFVSFNFDTSQLTGLNLSTPSVLATLAAALAPAHLRVGGTQGDYQVYAFDEYSGFDCAKPPRPMTSYRCKTTTPAQWGALLDFAAATNVSLLFGLNDLFMRPTKTKPETKLCGAQGAGPCPPQNLSNAEALLRYTATQKPPRALWGLELGNELNSCLNGPAGAKAQADDFAALSSLLDEVWSGTAAAERPKLVGPDTHSAAEYQEQGLAWFGTFIKESLAKGDHVDHFTFHMYSLGSGPKLDPTRLDASYLNAQSLDHSHAGAAALTRVAKAHGVAGRLWAGETAAANSGGQEGITDTFIDGFWYLDQLGTLATLNVTVFQRQVLVETKGYPMILQQGDSYLPLPDYFIALLHKRLMGQRVLHVNSSAESLRVYGHCAAPSVCAGCLALALINIGDKPAHVLPPSVGGRDQSNAVVQTWILTAGVQLPGAPNPLQSREALLNGAPLALSAQGSLPAMPGTSSQGAVEMPPTSYGFAVFPQLKPIACK